MPAFSERDLALLACLVPTAEKLAEQSTADYLAWLGKLSNHECALLVRWYANRCDYWPIAETIEEYTAN